VVLNGRSIKEYNTYYVGVYGASAELSAFLLTATLGEGRTRGLPKLPIHPNNGALQVVPHEAGTLMVLMYHWSMWILDARDSMIRFFDVPSFLYPFCFLLLPFRPYPVPLVPSADRCSHGSLQRGYRGKLYGVHCPLRPAVR
jgi:hypothetical protein